jgi:pimeloyl-ACP methyl ester carboxylesterase
MKILQRISKSRKAKILYGAGLIIVFAVTVIFLISGKKIIYGGEFVPLGDYGLYVRDYGKGEPTVIIEAGLNCEKDLYLGIQNRIARKTRVIAYDHAGIGESTSSPNPRTLPYYVEELKTLMNYKNIKPPYILVGHSMGGHIIRYYALLYPEEVAGLVFLDAPHEDWLDYARANWDTEQKEQYFRFWDPEINSAHYVGTGLVELSEYEANCDSIRGKKIPPQIPVLMFTAKNAPHFRHDKAGLTEDMKAWEEMQHSLIVGVENARQIVDWEAGHFIHQDKPQMVVHEINLFIDECMKKK